MICSTALTVTFALTWLIAPSGTASIQAGSAPSDVLNSPDGELLTRFSRITSVRELSDGRVLITDRLEGRLMIADFKDTAVVDIGRDGQGPGEYSGAGWLYALAGDSTLFTDWQTRRWFVLSGSTIVATSRSIDPPNRLLGAHLSGGDSLGHVLGVTSYRHAPGVPRIRTTADSLVAVSVTMATGHMDTIVVLGGRGHEGYASWRGTDGMNHSTWANPLASEDQVLMFRDGWIAVAWNSPYRVDWRSPEGRWFRGNPLSFTEVEVTDREKCAAWARLKRGSSSCDLRNFPGWPAVVPPLNPPGVLPVLLEGPNHCLLIVRTPSLRNPENRIDLVDRNGELVGTFRLADGLVLVGTSERAAYVTATDSLGLQTLTRHPW